MILNQDNDRNSKYRLFIVFNDIQIQHSLTHISHKPQAHLLAPNQNKNLKNIKGMRKMHLCVLFFYCCFIPKSKFSVNIGVFVPVETPPRGSGHHHLGFSTFESVTVCK